MPVVSNSCWLKLYEAVTLSHQGRRSCVCSQLSDCSDDNCRPLVCIAAVFSVQHLFCFIRGNTILTRAPTRWVQACKRPGGLIQ